MKSMKVTVMAMIMALTASTAIAQEKKADESKWPELKSFHQVMAQTFHPAEEGNYDPLRERAGELNEKALVLADSKRPAEYQTMEISNALKELAQKTASVNELVESKADNETLWTSINEAHDSFHKIVGLCKKDGHKHDHKHDDKHGKDDKHGH